MKLEFKESFLIYLLTVLASHVCIPHECTFLSQVGDPIVGPIKKLGKLVVSEIHQHTRPLDRVCLNELGCFSFDGPFGRSFHRPWVFHPQSREEINTTYRLYTRLNPKEPHLLKVHDQESISMSNYRPNRLTKFIVHGFLEYFVFEPKWIMNLVEQLLLHDDYNVITVDWSGGNHFPYSRAVTNTRIVGAEIALFVQFLVNTTGISTSSIHIIGHSLGAQIAGYAGERIKGLGRITGLDPAGPFFQGTDPVVRLDPSDANFVDVIHTNIQSELIFGLGMIDPCGHFDFYPNGAQSHPGCSRFAMKNLLSNIAEKFRRFLACEHQRSVDFFAASLSRYRCQMIGYPCSSFQDFLKGRCASCGSSERNCPVMGIDADRWKDLKKGNKSLVLYLKTSRDEPFCMPYYAIEVTVEESRSELNGRIYLQLIGEKSTTELDLRTDIDGYRKGNRHGFLVEGAENLDHIKEIRVKWVSNSSSSVLGFLQKPQTLGIQAVEIRQMHVPGQESITRFCFGHSSYLLDNAKPLLIKNLCPNKVF